MINVEFSRTLLDIQKFRQPNNTVDRVLTAIRNGDTGILSPFIFNGLNQYFDKDYKNKRHVFLVNENHPIAAGSCRGKTVILFKSAEITFNATLVHELKHSLDWPH